MTIIAAIIGLCIGATLGWFAAGIRGTARDADAYDQHSDFSEPPARTRIWGGYYKEKT